MRSIEEDQIKAAKEKIQLEKHLNTVREEALARQVDFNKMLKEDLKQIRELGIEAFSNGLAGAIVDAFEDGEKAFERFAKNFLKMIAQMILQALILRAIQSGMSAIGLSTGGQMIKAGMRSVDYSKHWPTRPLVRNPRIISALLC